MRSIPKNTRTRGLSICAAGASLALAAAFSPGVFPTFEPATAHAATGTIVNPQDDPAGTSVSTAINADAFDKANAGKPGHLTTWAEIDKDLPTTTSGGAHITGHALYMDQTIVATNGGGNTPLPAGIKVYMQWMDEDGSVSPIYVSKTYGPKTLGNNSGGAYGFAVPKWTDSNGNEHVFFPGGDHPSKARVWFEPFIDEPTGNPVTHIRTSQWNAGFLRMDSSLGGGSSVAPGNGIKDVNLYAYMEAGDNHNGGYLVRPEKEWKKTSAPTVSRPNDAYSDSVAGKVWYQGGSEPAGGGNVNVGPADGHGKHWAEGLEVVFSRFTMNGIAEIKKIEERERGLWPGQLEALLKAHPDYIEETVYSTVGSNGDYFIKFSGDYNRNFLYGFVRDPNGKPLLDAKGNPVMEHGKPKRESHVLQSYSSWTMPVVVAPNTFGPAVSPGPGATTASNNSWVNVGFGVMPYTNPDVTITYFDNNNHPANPGFPIKAQVDAYIPPDGSTLKWLDSSGKEVKHCDVKSDAEANACVLTIPKDGIKNGEVYTTELITTDNVEAADSVMVVVDIDGDGVLAHDPDSDNDGTPDHPTPPGKPAAAPNTHPPAAQNLTQGIKLVDGKGKPIPKHSPIKSDGDKPAGDEELRVRKNDLGDGFNPEEADFSTVKVTITDKNGETVDAGAKPRVIVWNGQGTKESGWLGAEGYPAVRNFGLRFFGPGTYDVKVSDEIDYWAPVTKPGVADLVSGSGTLTVDGNTPNKFVVMGYDSDNNRVADVDEAAQNQRYAPKYGPLAIPAGNPTHAKVPAPTFTDETGKPLTLDGKPYSIPGLTFTLGAGGAGGFTVEADGSVTVGAQVPAKDTPYTVPVDVTYPDGTIDHATATVTVTPPLRVNAPTIAAIDDQIVTLGEPIEPVTVTVDDENATVTVSGLPNGLDYDEDAGEISGTPVEEGDFSVTVRAEDAAGNASTVTFFMEVVRLDDEPEDEPENKPEAGKPDAGQPGKPGEPGGKPKVPGEDNPERPGGSQPTPPGPGPEGPAGPGKPGPRPEAPGTVTPVPPGSPEMPVPPKPAPVPPAPPATKQPAPVPPVPAPPATKHPQPPTPGKPHGDKTAPVISPLSDLMVTVGQPIPAVTVKVDDPKAKVTVAGLPDGVNFDPGKHTISGTPQKPGMYSVMVMAVDPAGNRSIRKFLMTVQPAPVVTPPVVPPSAPAPAPEEPKPTPSAKPTETQFGKPVPKHPTPNQGESQGEKQAQPPETKERVRRSNGLPRTGAQVGAALAVAGALIAGGVTILARSRRQK